jgi:hypothetical protein
LTARTCRELDERYLTAQAWEATGRHPRVINEMLERGGIELRAMDSRAIAALCRAIRDEFPALDLGAP